MKICRHIGPLTLLHSPRKYSAKPSAFVAVRGKGKKKKEIL